MYTEVHETSIMFPTLLLPPQPTQSPSTGLWNQDSNRVSPISPPFHCRSSIYQHSRNSGEDLNHGKLMPSCITTQGGRSLTRSGSRKGGLSMNKGRQILQGCHHWRRDRTNSVCEESLIAALPCDSNSNMSRCTQHVQYSQAQCEGLPLCLSNMWESGKWEDRTGAAWRSFVVFGAEPFSWLDLFSLFI